MPLPVNPPGNTLGKENAVLSGSGKRYFVPDFEGCLSLKSVLNGSAVWEAGGRSFRVDETSYLILNDRQRYSITIESHRPVTTFCLFFERGYVEDVQRSTLTSAGTLLDEPYATAAGGYFEALRPVGADLRSRLQTFAARLDEMSWIEWEERFLALAEMLVDDRGRTDQAIAKLPAIRHSTRTELYRRLLRGRDALLSSTESRFHLKNAAREACLSPYHFHRSFRQAFGETPHRYLVRHRLARAAGLLESHDRSVTEICLECGFESLSSFSTLFRERFGVTPGKIRKIRYAEATERR
jgi:AraC family transcriptional regulator